MLCSCYATALAGEHNSEDHDTDDGTLDKLHSAEVNRMADDKSWDSAPAHVPAAPKEVAVVWPKPAAKPEKKTLTGTVKWFHPEKSYGFIVGDDGVEHFAWFRDVEKDHNPARILVEGQKVSFLSVEGDKGQKAIRIRILPSDPAVETKFVLATKTALLKRAE